MWHGQSTGLWGEGLVLDLQLNMALGGSPSQSVPSPVTKGSGLHSLVLVEVQAKLLWENDLKNTDVHSLLNESPSMRGPVWWAALLHMVIHGPRFCLSCCFAVSSLIHMAAVHGKVEAWRSAHSRPYAQTQKRCLPLHLRSSWVHLVTWPCWTAQAIGIWSHAQPNSITWKKWEDGGEWLSMFTMPVPALPGSSTSHPSPWQLKKENSLVHMGNCSAFAFRVKIRRACKNVF